MSSRRESAARGAPAGREKTASRDRPGAKGAGRKRPASKEKTGGGKKEAKKELSAAVGAGVEIPEKLSSYARRAAVLDQRFHSKEELLRSLARVVVPGADPVVADEIYRGIEEREAAVNTYVGSGVAIPHARVDGVEGFHIAIARNRSGFPYGIETDEPVSLVVLVVGNEALKEKHVHLLGAIAKLLVQTELRDRILFAPDAAAVLRLLDTGAGRVRRRKPRPLTQIFLSNATKIGREQGVSAILVLLEDEEDLASLKWLKRSDLFIVATSSRRLADQSADIGQRFLLLPRVPRGSSGAEVRLTLLLALSHGLVRRGEKVVLVYGQEARGLDTMTIVEIGRQFGRFLTPSGAVAPGILPEVLERVIHLATDLAAEGREGRPVGTLFVVGDRRKLRRVSQQMVMNPFRGYPEEERNILDPTLAETIKEFASIDGAFTVDGKGVAISAGTWLKVDQDAELPGGFGARHRTACAITRAVNCIAVAVSQSTGEVTMFKGGSVILSLPRPRVG